jgi:2-polyprenyl-6-methoxyphenol hydroxylase-like FAD-dependent oxidoreductase
VPRKTITTQVAIMGAGPAGLMLSHLLATEGIESTVVEIRSRREIQETVRAGILEHGTVNMLVDSGVSDQVLREDRRPRTFANGSTRIDFAARGASRAAPQTIFKRSRRAGGAAATSATASADHASTTSRKAEGRFTARTARD